MNPTTSPIIAAYRLLLFLGLLGVSAAVQVEASLIAHYGFEETTLTNGSNISDSTGSNNGTVEGGDLTSVSVGVFGRALDVSPTGYVDIGTGVQISGDVTISFWIQNRVGTGNQGILGSANGIANGSSGFLIKPQDGARLFFDPETAGPPPTKQSDIFVNGPVDITDLSNVWSFVSVRFDSDPGSISFTVSDALMDPSALTGADLNTTTNNTPNSGTNVLWDSNGFAIGAQNGSGGNEASFTIDDLRFYDTVLTDAELITVGTTPIPEPSTVIFLISGIAIAFFAKKFGRKPEGAALAMPVKFSEDEQSAV